MTTQKDQLLNGSSPTALVAGQQPASAAAATAESAAPATAAAVTTAAKPAPGEKCDCCGQVMPADDEEDKPDPAAAAQPGAYTVDMAVQTLELCAIAKLPVADAKVFVAAKTPIAAVRAKLTANAAASADALVVDATSRPAGSAEANVAEAWNQVVAEQNAKLPQARR